MPLFAPTEAEDEQIEHRAEVAELSRETHTSGAKAPVDSSATTARLKSCPDTIPTPKPEEIVPAPAGPIRAATAILLPVVLIFLGSWADTLTVPGGLVNQILRFVG